MLATEVSVAANEISKEIPVVTDGVTAHKLYSWPCLLIVVELHASDLHMLSARLLGALASVAQDSERHLSDAMVAQSSLLLRWALLHHQHRVVWVRVKHRRLGAVVEIPVHAVDRVGLLERDILDLKRIFTCNDQVVDVLLSGPLEVNIIFM